MYIGVGLRLNKFSYEEKTTLYERDQVGEAISSSIVESAVNEVISRSMSKKQQISWTKEGAHHLLQVRIKALNNDLKDSFKK